MSSIKIAHYTQFNEETRQLIADLDQRYFPQPWTSENWKGVGENDREYLLSIGMIDKEICSFALFRLNPYENLSHLLKVLVAPDFRGRGLAFQLLEQCYMELGRYGFNKWYLEVATNNHQAISTYLKLGLTEVNRVRKFYSNGDDAIIMISPN